MVEHHIWLTGEMLNTASRLTAEPLDQPTVLDVDDDEQTIRRLVSRPVGQMGMWNAATASGDNDWSVEDMSRLPRSANDSHPRGRPTSAMSVR